MFEASQPATLRLEIFISLPEKAEIINSAEPIV